MACCGNADGTPRVAHATMYAVTLHGVVVDGEVWANAIEARSRMVALGGRSAGFGWGQRKFPLDGSVELPSQSRPCRGCG